MTKIALLESTCFQNWHLFRVIWLFLKHSCNMERHFCCQMYGLNKSNYCTLIDKLFFSFFFTYIEIWNVFFTYYSKKFLTNKNRNNDILLTVFIIQEQNCIALPALHCSALQCIALHCTKLHCSAMRSTVVLGPIWTKLVTNTKIYMKHISTVNW